LTDKLQGRDDHSGGQLPPLPSHAKSGKHAILVAPASRSEEFEGFKKGKGSEMNRILCENKSNALERLTLFINFF
jgi:hypothetical protein